MSIHTHRWKLVLHLDRCHSYESRYSCECGAHFRTSNERSPRDDPYAAVWMTKEGGEEACARCTALMDGAKPESHDEVFQP